jgi:predicted acyltransferase
MNSIAAYCMDHLWLNFIRSALKTHLGANAFLVLGPAYESLLLGGAALAVLWLILYWMYRQKLFIKI